MPKFEVSTIVAAALLALVVGGGVYVTYVRQPAELDRLEKAEQVAEMERTEMKTLLAEYASSKEQAARVMSQWRSRYKIVPDTLTSPEVVGYLNERTQRGFDTFDLNVEGIQRDENYSHYALRANGRGYFSSLYQFVWQIENSRPFYSVEGLSLSHIDLITKDEASGRERLQVMVSFNMGIHAYFGGPEGLSASGSAWRPAGEGREPRPQGGGALPPVPSKVLADANPDINPFFPGIMDQVPPNTRGLVNVEEAQLVSIVGGQAVFKDGQGLRRVEAGDDVYLGQITDVAPTEGRVTAVLNRGGIIDDVVRTLGRPEDAYRRAIGPTKLVPRDSSRTRPANR